MDRIVKQITDKLYETYGEPTGDRYRVWWIPQVPGKAFKIEVPSLDVGKLVCAILAQYDIFQFENRIKPDFANVGGIEKWDETDGEWYSVDEEDA